MVPVGRGTLVRNALLLLLLAPAAAPQEARDVARILDDHARALGAAAARVKTLEAEEDIGAHHGVKCYWELPRRMLREVPTPAGAFPWREYFGPEGAFVERGFFERFRGNQATTRGGYYLYLALAEPFPLLPYVGNPALQKGLQVGRAEQDGKRYEVLFTPRDRNGVRAVYLLDAETHLLANVRFEEEENQPFVNVTFTDHREVQGVMLPGQVYARNLTSTEDPEQKRLRPMPGNRASIVRKWVINPDVSQVRFTPPGLGRGGGEGFEAHVHATGPDPHELAAGDLDGDGKPDVAVACEGAVYVHFGGDPDHPVAVPLGKGHMRGLAIDDFDCDGRPELVTGSYVEPDRTFFFVGFDADRKPAVRKLYGAPNFVHEIVAEDLDLDGIPDLVSTGFASQDLEILFGNGAGGSRLTGTTWPLSNGGTERGYGVAVGDLEGDRMHDIAVADGTRVVIFRGAANATFPKRIYLPEKVDPTRPWRPVAVALADLDGDGNQDLVIGREHPLEDLPDDVVVLMNTGTSFRTGAAVDAGARVQSVGTGLFTADAHRDVVATSFLTGELVLLPGDGKGGLGRGEHFVSGRGAARVAVADLDGDGRDDAAVSNRLDDTLTLFLNRRAAPRHVAAAPARAVPCPPPTPADFRLEGLTRPYAFVGEFRLPRELQDPSGLVCLGSVPSSTQLLVVSDKRPALFRATLDRAAQRLLVSPAIPLQGLADRRLDLEAAAWDDLSGSLLLGCEADSTVLRTDVFGHVLGRAPTGLGVDDNDGLEALALRRLKDGTPVLYAFRERLGVTGRQPPLAVLTVDDDPFRLKERHKDVRLPLFLADQTGATVFDGRLYVVSRLARGIVELAFDGDLFAKEYKVASYQKLVDDLLALKSPKTPLFGNVEAIAFDYNGDLFLLVDNNREVMGRDGVNRGDEGRLLWFRNEGTFERRVVPDRVVVRRIVIPDGEGAEEKARAALARVQAGDDIDRVAEELGGRPAQEVRVVANHLRPEPGERRQADLTAAFGRLVFQLDPGEAGLAEFHKADSPEGWQVVLRVK